MLSGPIRVCIREEQREQRGDHEVVTGYDYKTKLVDADILRRRLGRSRFAQFLNFEPITFEGHSHVTLS